MKMKNLIYSSLAIILVSTVISCVPARKFQELKTKNQKCEEEREQLNSKNKELTVSNTELKAQSVEIGRVNEMLSKDTLVMGKSLRKMTMQYDKINRLNDELLEKQKELAAGSATEAKKLLEELQRQKEDLQRKEDALRDLEKSVEAKKKNLEEFQKEINLMNNTLSEKNKRLVELEGILSSKDSIVNALKNKVSAALRGFEGDGLTIVEKNGKVYVSLDEKLLFKSGKWEVDPKGQAAIKKLAEVLEKNDDINVMVEGHTDDVPFGGNGNIADNWDLSVKRATAIVKIILSGSTINPTRLTSAGRGEFLPIDPAKTTEARQKNRRTEIILTPKLDELFKILESN
jgi:chemotaxis protein MotB